MTATFPPLIGGQLMHLFNFASDEAQRAFVKYYFQSSTNKAFDVENKELAEIKYPFTADYFGGWDNAYPEVMKRSSAIKCRKENRSTRLAIFTGER